MEKITPPAEFAEGPFSGLATQNALEGAVSQFEYLHALLHAVDHLLEEIQEWTAPLGVTPDETVRERAFRASRLTLLALGECNKAKAEIEPVLR